MKNKNNFYNRKFRSMENRFDRLRTAIIKEFKPIVKQKVLSLKIDCISTQHGFYPSNGFGETERFKNLQHFIYSFDNYQIEFLFEVEKGKFKWFR